MNSHEDGRWLSILEYCEYRNKSISTIRRYIKSGNLKYRFENNKYEIYVANYNSKRNKEEIIEDLKREIRKLKEENSELKMLVNLYEQKPQFSIQSKNIRQ